LEEPAAYFLNLVTGRRLLPVPRHTVERYGQSWTEPRHLVTNGPFRLEAWSPGERVILRRNPHYFGRPHGNVTQVIVSNQQLAPAEALEAYRAGGVDILSLGAKTYSARFRYAEEYRRAEAATAYVVGFDLTKAPFHDRRVRQALALSLDRDYLARQSLPDFDVAGRGGLLPPGFPGHSPEIGLRCDPEKAARLLAEAGYPNGKGFGRVVLATLDTRRQYALALQRIWRQRLGIHILVKEMKADLFFKHFHRAPLFIMGWWTRYPSPYNALRHAAEFLAPSWEHAGFERTMDEAARTSEYQGRLRRLRQADRIFVTEAAVVPLAYRANHYLVKPWVSVSLPYFSMQDITIHPH
jgi:ABC-type oligopeptide transport system substrate-binding subunit